MVMHAHAVGAVRLWIAIFNEKPPELATIYHRKIYLLWTSSGGPRLLGLCTICALYPDFAYRAKEPLGEFKAHIANMWSLVARPETGDLWLAIRDFPAQRGGYEHFNLNDLLGRQR